MYSVSVIWGGMGICKRSICVLADNSKQIWQTQEKNNLVFTGRVSRKWIKLNIHSPFSSSADSWGKYEALRLLDVPLSSPAPP